VTTLVLILVVAIVASDLAATGLDRVGKSMQATGRRLTKRAAGMGRVRLAGLMVLAVIAIAAT
jgi:hypothetical protein